MYITVGLEHETVPIVPIVPTVPTEGAPVSRLLSPVSRLPSTYTTTGAYIL